MHLSESRYGSMCDRESEYRHQHRGQTATQHTQLTGGTLGEVDNTAFDKGAAIVDQYLDGLTGIGTLDQDFGPERQAGVGRGQRLLVKKFATGGGRTLKAVAVERSDAGFQVNSLFLGSVSLDRRAGGKHKEQECQQTGEQLFGGSSHGIASKFSFGDDRFHR